MAYSGEQSYTFTYGLENTNSMPIEVTLDCTSSTNMAYSDPKGRVTKVVHPGELEFLMYAEALSGYDEFARGAQVSWKEVS